MGYGSRRQDEKGERRKRRERQREEREKESEEREFIMLQKMCEE